MMDDLKARTEEEEEEEEKEGTRLCICSLSSSSGRRAHLTLPAPHPQHQPPGDHKLACMQQLHGTRQTSGRRKRHQKNEVEANHFLRGRDEEDLAGYSVMRRAHEVQANLAIKFPSFVRVMLPSAVYRGFWVTLPKDFCQLHLPRHDTVLVLVGEIDQKEYKINYLGQRRALSGGWKRFSQEHKLVAGDVLIFHLIRASKFKVYIVRVNCLGEVDAALGLIDLRFHGNRRPYAREQHLEGHISQDNHPPDDDRNKLSKLEPQGNEATINCNNFEGVWSPGLYLTVNHLRGIAKFIALDNAYCQNIIHFSEALVTS